VLDPDKFRRELELQGITIAELSARSGMNYSHLSNMKNGKVKHVKFETLMNLARHLNNIPPYRLISDSILNIARQDIRDSIESLPKKQWPSYLQETLDDESSASSYVNRFPIIGHIRENGEHDLPAKLSRGRFAKTASMTRMHMPSYWKIRRWPSTSGREACCFSHRNTRSTASPSAL